MVSNNLNKSSSSLHHKDGAHDSSGTCSGLHSTFNALDGVFLLKNFNELNWFPSCNWSSVGSDWRENAYFFSFGKGGFGQEPVGFKMSFLVWDSSSAASLFGDFIIGILLIFACNSYWWIGGILTAVISLLTLCWCSVFVPSFQSGLNTSLLGCKVCSRISNFWKSRKSCHDSFSNLCGNSITSDFVLSLCKIFEDW